MLVNHLVYLCVKGIGWWLGKIKFKECGQQADLFSEKGKEFPGMCLC